jgi:phage terminase large subunit GpA-like protein
MRMRGKGKKVKSSTKAMFRSIFGVLKPPPNLKLSEWADKYRRLAAGTTAEPGRWRTDKAPYQREIMDAITDITVKKVVIMSAAQIGKTDAAILNPIGYYIHYDPSPIMVIEPTIDMAEKFSKEKLSPMLRGTPVLIDRVNDKSRTSGNTISQKIFPGGFVTIAGANSPTGLRSHTVRIILADEIDAYPPSAGNEGDPLLLATKRQTTYWNKKQVDISTPTIKGTSRIEVEYQHSSRGEWYVPCPSCGEMQPLVWSNIVFNKEDLSEIHYVCRKCGVLSSEVEWKELYINGKFIHEDPDNQVKGYHLNTFASTLTTWREAVEKFLLADEEKKNGNIHPLKVWTNTELGETWEEDGEQIEEEELLKRRERYNCEVPDEVMYITAGVDTQDDRFEVEVVGWGPEYESWGIKYAAIYGDLKIGKVWEDLDIFLQQTFQKSDGTKMKIICTCMDTGGHFTNQVYKFCKERFNRRVFAVKGSNDSSSAYIQSPTKSNREQAYLFKLGVDTGKSLLLQRLKIAEEGPGYCHFPKDEKGKPYSPRGYDEKFFIGITAERQVVVYKKGRPAFEWRLKDKGKHKRNEALDCRNYATAAIEIANVPLKKPEKKDPAAGTATKKTKKKRRVSGGIA